MEYVLSIELFSETIIGDQEGWGNRLDVDCVYDKYGIPYIPAKRIKGLLRDSAEEFLEVLGYNQSQYIELLFGDKGKKQGALSIDNAYLEDYDEISAFLERVHNDNTNMSYREIFNYNRIIQAFTTIRYQIKVQDGISSDNSLRLIRVLNKGLKFSSNINIYNSESIKDTEKVLELLAKGVKNMGLMRNRGYGKVHCEVKKVN